MNKNDELQNMTSFVNVTYDATKNDASAKFSHNSHLYTLKISKKVTSLARNLMIGFKPYFTEACERVP